MGKWKPEYNKNRHIIPLNMNQTELDCFIKKYGVKPNGKLIKDVLFKDSVSIRNVIIDKSKEETNFQLKKLGNNMNQIAWHLNTNPNLLSSSDHKKLLYTIQELEKTLKAICE